jgi:hypothetical protein
MGVPCGLHRKGKTMSIRFTATSVLFNGEEKANASKADVATLIKAWLKSGA